MWNKAPKMTAEMRKRGIAIPDIGGGEMADIVAYLYSIQYFAEGGDPQAGRRSLSRDGCLDCHSLNGRGRGTAGDLAAVAKLSSPAEVISSLWNHSALMESGGEAEGPWRSLTPDEMANLMAFLQRNNGE
jgi:mono/diheme cytochrome c family protein